MNETIKVYKVNRKKAIMQACNNRKWAEFMRNYGERE